MQVKSWTLKTIIDFTDINDSRKEKGLLLNTDADCNSNKWK